jgi:hypothetical protein
VGIEPTTSGLKGRSGLWPRNRARSFCGKIKGIHTIQVLRSITLDDEPIGQIPDKTGLELEPMAD